MYTLFEALYAPDELEILGGSIRSVIAAPEGKKLVVSDLGSIESRVVGWLSGCQWINQQFAAGRDTYKAFAEMWLGVPYARVSKEQRTLAKPPFLGFAYRLGGTTLVDYAAGMGVEMSEETCREAIAAARSACPEITLLWREFEEVACQVVTSGQPQAHARTFWRIEGDFMTIQLPSGRKLWYHQPRWELADTPWGKKVMQFTYMGQNQFTKQWTRLANHGGRFVEQITQAIAADVLYVGMRRYEAAGGTVVGHIHDEILGEEPEELATLRLEQMNAALSASIDWAPGLLLSSEGYISKRYKK